VGKSLTAKALAQAIERGDYPELKGKTVFRFNMADLIDQQASLIGGSNKTLNQISDAMGHHRKDIFLVFDEIHMACKNNQKMADQLKLFLDEGGEFPHVIGITTEEEYEKHVKENHAFSLRFDRVAVASTSQEETLMVLKETLLKSRSKPLLSDEDVLQRIYQKSQQKEGPQPAEALKLLKKCIQRTEQTQRSPLEKKMTQLMQKLEGLYLQPGLYLEKQALEKERVELKKQLLFEEQEKKKLFQAKSTLDQAKSQMHQALLKTKCVVEGNVSPLQEQKQLQHFFLLNRILCPFLESYVQTKSKELGLKVVIDRELVEEVSALS
jgi:ATP-dependent Clp protease ATP-binding subunit ClpC